MSYPVTPSTISISQAVDVIAASEASILQGLNDLFCNSFVTPVLASTITGQDKLTIISNVLNIMACKESTVAGVIDGLADIVAVDRGLIPAKSPNSDCACKCK